MLMGLIASQPATLNCMNQPYALCRCIRPWPTCMKNGRECYHYDPCLTRCDDGLDAGLPACARLREGVLLAVQVGQLVAALLHDIGEVQGVPLPKVRHMARQVEACAGQGAQSATCSPCGTERHIIMAS